MSAVSVFNTAVSLSRQGVHQDRAKNYAEAARCYREAITAFTSVRGKCSSPEVAHAIDEKVSQYRDRLRKIDRYLLGKADLSKLFKSACDFHRQQEAVVAPRASSSSRSSVQHGLQLIERAKRKDAKGLYREALPLYEEGMANLLEVAVAEQAGSPESSETIRFKCLLVHERADAIRSFLESGLPIAERNRPASSGFDSCSASPEPLGGEAEAAECSSLYENEDHLMLMEEVRSNFSYDSQAASSSHSLYPTCEIKRQPSVISGNSDFLDFGNDRRPVPLANIDQELSLSAVSLKSQQTETARQRTNGVRSATVLSSSSSASSLSKPHKYRSLHVSAEDILSAFSSRDSSFEEAEKDRNVSELTYDPKTAEFSLDFKARGGSPASGSDSGISDPSSTIKRHHDSSSATPPTTPTFYDENTRHYDDVVFASHREDLRLSKLSLNERRSPRPSSFVEQRRRPRSTTPSAMPRDERPLAMPSPEAAAERKALSRGASRKSKKLMKSGSVDEVRVLFSEDVVDDGAAVKMKPLPVSGVKVKGDSSYSYGTREHYVPPRAFARREDCGGDDDDDEGLNKGCYYLMSCLDAFWIL